MKHRLLLLFGLCCFCRSFVSGQTPVLVWPGDANNNGVVNNVDFLNLGLAYNFFGPARDSINVGWGAQNAQPWPFVFANGANFAHADANGDGIVQYNYDAFPIYVYYGLTHGQVNGDVYADGLAGIDPPLYFDVPAQDTVVGGQTINLPIHLGSAALPMEDFYGLAFSVVVDSGLVDIDQIQSHFNEFSWANPDGDRIYSTYRASNTQIDMAWVRIDHNQKNGAGKIGSFDFIVIEDVWDVQRTFNIRIENIRAIDKYGNETSVAGDTIQITVKSSILADDNQRPTKNSFQVFPNPASDHLFLQADEPIKSATLYNALGQVVLRCEPLKTTHDLPLPILPIGTYCLVASTERQVFYRKITVAPPKN